MPGKAAVNSLTIISAIVVLLAQFAQMVGYTISETDQEALVNLINSGLIVVTTAISIIGAVGAIIGRVRASKPVTGILSPSEGG